MMQRPVIGTNQWTLTSNLMNVMSSRPALSYSVQIYIISAFRSFVAARVSPIYMQHPSMQTIMIDLTDVPFNAIDRKI